jgi:hypothetical protein
MTYEDVTPVSGISSILAPLGLHSYACISFGFGVDIS